MGVKKAEENKLSREIIDIIREHHGTSIVSYFFMSALKENNGEDTVKSEDFRYPGPIPTSKEACLVMLADGIEAASRSIENPSVKQLEATIDKICNDKILDGQLDAANLTMAEIRLIKDAFLPVLRGVFHKRIEYPKDEKAVAGSNINGQHLQLNKTSPDKSGAQKNSVRKNGNGKKDGADTLKKVNRKKILPVTKSTGSDKKSAERKRNPKKKLKKTSAKKNGN